MWIGYSEGQIARVWIGFMLVDTVFPAYMYIFLRLGPWFGDPHIVTTDGLSYTFNGEGEYLFTRIGDNETVIQARTERVKLSEGG